MAVIQASAVFKINPAGFNLRRGISLLVVMLIPLVVLGALGEEKYFLSTAYGALYTGLSDPGGKYAYRAPRMAVVGAVGALLTALGFWLGDQAWGWVALAAFAVTLLGGLAVKYGAHWSGAALMLNFWFLIALPLPALYKADHVHTSPWPQALAWLIGSALMIGYVGVLSLARRRPAQQNPAAAMMPGDTTPVPLTPPVIAYAVLRAVALGLAVAIPFGLNLPNADWIPIAALAAMKPSLQQSELTAVQRLAGAVIGAVLAVVFLLGADNKIVLGAAVVVLGALAGAIWAWNYTWYCAAVAGAVLIGEDVSNPTNLSEEALRVAFTFVGVGIAVVVMLLGNLLAKRSSGKARPQPAAPAGGSGRS
ncbi:FUSC family protein [Kitasatospora sp. NPDC097643]|uniref:FUSC family protein n=1 Tax=Kitasatospora sp. NPDC097643 TaxID=3157230 RepID=UPI0033192210